MFSFAINECFSRRYHVNIWFPNNCSLNGCSIYDRSLFEPIISLAVAKWWFLNSLFFYIYSLVLFYNHFSLFFSLWLPWIHWLLFIEYIAVNYSHSFWCLDCPKFGQCLLDISHHYLSTSLLSSTMKCHRLTPYFLCPRLGPLSEERHLETKIWGLGMFRATRVSQLIAF